MSSNNSLLPGVVRGQVCSVKETVSLFLPTDLVEMVTESVVDEAALVERLRGLYANAAAKSHEATWTGWLL